MGDDNTDSNSGAGNTFEVEALTIAAVGDCSGGNSDAFRSDGIGCDCNNRRLDTR